MLTRLKPRPTATERLIREYPISWGRAVGFGMVGAVMMMAWIDTFFMLGQTDFAFEHFVGSLLHGSPYGARTWFPGFLANLILGGLFGVMYAYAFENYSRRATASVGIRLGAIHAALAGVFFFPFMRVLHEEAGMPLYERGFGFLGASVSPATPLLILVGHLIFGMTMGTLYGPVGVERLHARRFEPGETGRPGEPGVKTAEDDPEDRVAA